MCWKSKNNRIMVSDTDIPVFKICRVNSLDDKVYPYFHGFYFDTISYMENTTYDCGDPFTIQPFKMDDVMEYNVFRAMHSYSLENIRLFCATDDYSVYPGTYNTTAKACGVIARPAYYTPPRLAIMLCTIPKGTRYAINEVGELVSDCIDVVKIFKQPFTFNKDGSLSKRSVERVNGILNDWEKGKLMEKEYVLEKL